MKKTAWLSSRLWDGCITTLRSDAGAAPRMWKSGAAGRGKKGWPANETFHLARQSVVHVVSLPAFVARARGVHLLRVPSAVQGEVVNFFQPGMPIRAWFAHGNSVRWATDAEVRKEYGMGREQWLANWRNDGKSNRKNQAIRKQ